MPGLFQHKITKYLVTALIVKRDMRMLGEKPERHKLMFEINCPQDTRRFVGFLH